MICDKIKCKKLYAAFIIGNKVDITINKSNTVFLQPHSYN